MYHKPERMRGVAHVVLEARSVPLGADAHAKHVMLCKYRCEGFVITHTNNLPHTGPAAEARVVTSLLDAASFVQQQFYSRPWSELDELACRYQD